ncbi:hypothetical protein SISNIDRAFT_470830 [Sistotremastrum niveocremeum HHB9708]|uniref:SWIM-type domain-containing protein n=1 Tax=Sistotremastrum niveocremeum HHB9708 TaxID=1314777 RepID=A0A164NC85_9AGAM|nr:hypothetical protein SISNIDRAFT_470830 [Sistotremastrum niveocremeum HHB9708]
MNGVDGEEETQLSPEGKAILEYLDYFDSTWMSEALWESWSPYEMFAANRALQHHANWVTARFSVAANHQTLPLHIQRRSLTSLTPQFPPLAYWNPAKERDALAQKIFAETATDPERLKFHPKETDDQFVSDCRGTAPLPSIPPPYHRQLVHKSGWAWCTCPDFTQRRVGACKHLRAVRIFIDLWQQRRQLRRYFDFPDCLDSAIKVYERNCRIWGPDFDRKALHLPIPPDPEEMVTEIEQGSNHLPGIAEIEFMAEGEDPDTEEGNVTSGNDDEAESVMGTQGSAESSRSASPIFGDDLTVDEQHTGSNLRTREGIKAQLLVRAEAIASKTLEKLEKFQDILEQFHTGECSSSTMLSFRDIISRINNTFESLDSKTPVQ